MEQWHVSWNKGKTKEDDVRIREGAAKAAKSLIGNKGGRAATEEGERERRRKISDSQKVNPRGGLKEGSGRGKKSWHESPIAGRVYLHSSYELAYAQWLDVQGVNWVKNKIGFDYVFEGKICKYYPDFVLTDTNQYVELKGYKTSKDEAKCNHFPYELCVLYRQDLKNLGLNIQ